MSRRRAGQISCVTSSNRCGPKRRCRGSSGIRSATSRSSTSRAATNPGLTFERARSLFFGYVRLRDDVVGEVDATLDSLFEGRPSLGVHYRGTDKRSEADLVPHERMFRAIDAELARGPADAKLFVATDEQAFLDQCVARYGVRTVSLPDHRRSTDDRPVHVHPDGDGYSLGRDALFNCLALAQCNRVLKTASILSAWAKVFNPATRHPHAEPSAGESIVFSRAGDSGLRLRR